MNSQPSLASRVAELSWYHTLELAPGVTTPGWFDLRDVPRRLPMPASLAGQRVLDIGTFDGFWGLEMERRGAAEVVAIDVLDPLRWDWPVGASEEVVEVIGQRQHRGEGFELAISALGSSVTRHELSVYDLSPDTVGQFDFVYLGSLLLHLRDPVAALENVRSVCRGQLLVLDAADVFLSLLHPNRALADLDGRLRPWWWKPNRAGLVRMLEAAGFDVEGTPRWVFMPPGGGQARPRFDPRLLLTRGGRQSVVSACLGDPHLAVTAHPSPGVRDPVLERRQR